MCQSSHKSKERKVMLLVATNSKDWKSSEKAEHRAHFHEEYQRAEAEVVFNAGNYLCN